MSDDRVRKLLLETRREIRNVRDGQNTEKRILPPFARATSFQRLIPLPATETAVPTLSQQPQQQQEISLPIELHVLRVAQPLSQTSTVNTLMPSDPELVSYSEGKINLNQRMQWNGDTFRDQPTSRNSALLLDKYLTEMLEKMQESNKGSLSEPAQRVQYMRDCQRLYNMVIHEVTRQVSAHCIERGQLLAKLWVRSVDVFNGIMDVFNDYQTTSKKRIRELEEELKNMRKSSLLSARSAEIAVKTVTEGAKVLIQGHIDSQQKLNERIVTLQHEVFRLESRVQKLHRDLHKANDDVSKSSFWERLYRKCMSEKKLVADELTTTRVALMDRTREIQLLKGDTDPVLTRSLGIQTEDNPPQISTRPDLTRFTLRTFFVPTQNIRRNPEDVVPPLPLVLPPLYTHCSSDVEVILKYTAPPIHEPESLTFLQPVGKSVANWPSHWDKYFINTFEKYEAMIYPLEWQQIIAGKVIYYMSLLDQVASYEQGALDVFSSTFTSSMHVRILDLLTSLRTSNTSSLRLGLLCLLLGIGFEPLPKDTAQQFFQCVRMICSPFNDYPKTVSASEVMNACKALFSDEAREELFSLFISKDDPQNGISTDAAMLYVLRIILKDRRRAVERKLQDFFLAVYEMDSARLLEVEWVFKNILYVELPEHSVMEQLYPYKKMNGDGFVKLMLLVAVDPLALAGHISTLDPINVRRQMTLALSANTM